MKPRTPRTPECRHLAGKNGIALWIAVLIAIAFAFSGSAFAADDAAETEATRQQLERLFDFMVGGAVIDTLCGIQDPDIPETLWHYTRFEQFVDRNNVLIGRTVDEHFHDTVPAIHRNLPDCNGEARTISTNWKNMVRGLMPMLGLPSYAGEQSDEQLSRELFAAVLEIHTLARECEHLPPERQQFLNQQVTVVYSLIIQIYGEEFLDREIARFLVYLENGGLVLCTDITSVEHVTIGGLRKTVQLNRLLSHKLEH